MMSRERSEIEGRSDRRRALVARMLLVDGALLLAVAVIHLVMTSELGRIVANNTSI